MPLFPSIEDRSFAVLKDRIDSLGAAPPQVLLLEGGSETQRLEMARYWACRCNCPEAASTGHPCLTCRTCLQTAAQEHFDILGFDGRIPNKQDEENPGLIRALNIANVRNLKRMLQEPPHGTGYRVILLMGLEGFRSSAANGLLKSMEEPSPTSLFVLLTPQREQLLPTLVSRSFCMTLPWPNPEAVADNDASLRKELAAFLQTGQGFFTKTGSKNFDLAQAQEILAELRKVQIRLLAGNTTDSGELEGALRPLGKLTLAQTCRFLDEAQNALALAVNPTRVIEALLAALFSLLHPKPAA